MRPAHLLAICVLLCAAQASAQDLLAPSSDGLAPGAGVGASPAAFQDSSGGIIGGRAGRPRIAPPRPGMRRSGVPEALPTPRGRAGATRQPALGNFAFDAPVGPKMKARRGTYARTIH